MAEVDTIKQTLDEIIFARLLTMPVWKNNNITLEPSQYGMIKFISNQGRVALFIHVDEILICGIRKILMALQTLRVD